MIRDKVREVRNSQNSKDFVSQAIETGEFGARQWLASLSWVVIVFTVSFLLSVFSQYINIVMSFLLGKENPSWPYISVSFPLSFPLF